MAVGFAVAGGHSRRMGRDKALLPWGESTLLDHTLARLREACGEVRILTGPTARYADRGLPVDADLIPGTGPLGGLYTGLLHLTSGALGLFLAVDLPRVPVSLLQALLDLAEGFDVVIDKNSLAHLDSVTIDYSEDSLSSGFKITNPKEKGSCGCGESKQF